MLQDGAARVDWGAGLLGFAFGGFLDGILLHQVLQWHHLLSGWEPYSTAAELRFHMLWDGAFHAAHYLLLALGLWLLWRPRTAAAGEGRGGLAGWFAIGFGAWHLLDAVVNHWALRLHRIRQDAAEPLAWDLVFFGLGLAAVVLGWRLLSRGPGPRRPGVAGLAAVTLLAGAGAALPPRGEALAALVLPAPEVAQLLAVAAEARLAGVSSGGEIWVFATADMARLRRAALAHGARPAPLPVLPATGCLTAL
jgi:uncharacterized membrane protein